MVKRLSFILVKKHLVGCPLCEKLGTVCFSQRGAALRRPQQKATCFFSLFLSLPSLSLQDGRPGRSVGQSVEEAVDQGRRLHQVLQLQVEDPLEALGPLGAELRPQTQDAIQRGRSLGRGGRRATTQVISEAADHFILQLLHPLGVLQAWDLLCGRTHTLKSRNTHTYIRANSAAGVLPTSSISNSTSLPCMANVLNRP